MRYICCIAVLLLIAGCADNRVPPASQRADDAQDTASDAAVYAAEMRARAAEGTASRSDAAAALARAEALAQAATAEDARQLAMRAEAEARAQREEASSIAHDRARLGWWATAAGAALLVVAAALSVLGFWYGLGRLVQGAGAACTASGVVALALGLSWGWLPALAAVVVIGGALFLLLKRAAGSIDRHAERMAVVDPLVDGQTLRAKATSAREQAAAGVWTAVQRLRGKSTDRGRLSRLLS